MKLEGYSDYEIYPETGQVWSYKRNKFIANKKGNGYKGCTMTNDNGEIKHWLLHRLIWTTVNGEIPYGMQVNHIDENKHNNSIFNLNLMTNYENSNWGTRNTRLKKTKPVLAIQDGIIKYIFTNLSNAKTKGFQTKEISKCIKGMFKQHKGYQWKYLDDYLADWWEQEMEKAV